MDAVMYLKEKARMTGPQKTECLCGIMCEDCPLSSNNNGTKESCSYFEMGHPEKAVEIVEKWSKEHPQKTYLSDFLEKHPKAEMYPNSDRPNVCAKVMGYVTKCPRKTCEGCWNTPMEE